MGFSVTARKLRAVAEGEPAPRRKRPLSLIQAIELGDPREILLAQRREIAGRLPNESGPAAAALHRQLTLISKEIEAIDARTAEDGDGGRGATPDDAWEAV